MAVFHNNKMMGNSSTNNKTRILKTTKSWSRLVASYRWSYLHNCLSDPDGRAPRLAREAKYHIHKTLRRCKYNRASAFASTLTHTCQAFSSTPVEEIRQID